jgi:hypothetical protein
LGLARQAASGHAPPRLQSQHVLVEFHTLRHGVQVASHVPEADPWRRRRLDP